jgi:RNA polymerase sigma-70 factor (ECF subfamily)
VRRLQHRGLSQLAAEAAFQAESPRTLATLTRVLGSLDLAEDAVQDAFVVALERWPQDGIPTNPGAWITTTARNKALDRLRREAKRQDKQHAAHRSLAALDGWDSADPNVVRDDLLRLVFTCCHPTLPIEGRVALALRTLCGLSTAQVARLFLMPEPTMAQRLVRAKRRLADDEVPYEVPSAHELPDRLPAVLATVHLLFTEGHTASSGPTHVREELCNEAKRLAALLVELMPDEPEVLGLHALILLTDARRDTRVDDQGELVTLADQDRSRWNHHDIELGADAVEQALRRGAAGAYQLQAAIAACHATAPTYADTDWAEIAALYGLLEQLDGDPVTRLNRAVAMAEAYDPATALALLEDVDGLDGHHLRWAVEGDLLRRLERFDDARAAYGRALACSPNDVERRFLVRRRDELLGFGGDQGGR